MCWIRNASDEAAVANGCYYDAAAADRVCSFFPKVLRHSKGQLGGKPFALLPWEENDLLRPLFGWLRPDGSRRFRRAYVEIPKKNGKSSLCAGISLFGLVADNEPGAQNYNCAYDREQATIIFDEAASMVRKSKALRQRLKIVESQKRINYPAKEGKFRSLSKETAAAEGLNIHFLVFDELHTQKTRQMWDTLIYGGAARRQPLVIAITTAGYDKTTICWEQHEYARKIISGELIDEQFFGLIYAADPKEDWTSEDVWRRANPSMGTADDVAEGRATLTIDSMRADCLEAQQSPAKEASFKRYRLNIWTSSEVLWLPMDKWDECPVMSDEEIEAECGFATEA